MSPDADGRFRGISVPRIPWHGAAPPASPFMVDEYLQRDSLDDDPSVVAEFQGDLQARVRREEACAEGVTTTSDPEGW